MSTPSGIMKYKNHRFPVEIISHAVWLYFRFSLSFRDVEELLLERGVSVTYEAIRKGCRKFGQPYASQLRRRRPRPSDKWHMDEGCLRIKGEHHYLWRAVDQDGTVLDLLVQRRRDKRAAKKFFRKLLKGLQYVPWVIITDKLKSYAAAKRLSGKPRKGSAWLRRSLCQAAWAASPTKETYLAARFHRLAARKGKKRAIMAVARTILVSVYHMLKTKQPYRELGADFLDRRQAEHVKRYLLKRLEHLGLQVTVRSVEDTAALPA